jgi:hypothetical protein
MRPVPQGCGHERRQERRRSRRRVSLLLGSSVGALTVWLANVSWVIAALVALAAFFMFYAWGAYRE